MHIATRYFTAGTRSDWRILLCKHNCTSFRFWHFEVELDRMCGSLNVEFVLLGLGFWLCFAVAEPSSVFREALAEIVRPEPVAEREETR